MSRLFPKGASRGFTLVELVTVLILLGILSVYVMPRFFDLDFFRERGFSDETLAGLRYAQKLAVASGCEVRVSITAGSYVLNQRATSCSSGAFTRPVPHPGSSDDFAGIAPAGTVLAPAITVTFDAMGRANGIAGDSLDLAVGGKTLRLWRESGYVEQP